jgi:outer membrane translocation and assembly module TamA
MRSLAGFVLISSLLFVSNQTGLAQEKKILVEDLVISGTRSVDSAELAEITNSIAGSSFDDDAGEMGQRIRAPFQEHGYYHAEVEKLDFKVIDPLASPKPVRLEAQVSEGPRCRVSGVEFTGNHAFSSEELTAKLAIKPGDVFRRSKVAMGMGALRKLCSSRGYLDFVFVMGDHADSSSTVKLDIEVREGQQYRMDKLEIVAPPEVAAKLQTRWELEPGAIYVAGYVKTFLEANSSLLPADFTE